MAARLLDMSDRRKPKNEVTPEYEDRGLFKTTPARWRVQLVPQFATTSRDDLIVKGFLDGESAIEVVFAGRRRTDVEPVVALLRSMWTHANANIVKGAEPPHHDQVRLMAVIEGSWRPRFKLDTQGWQTRDHQLNASRWQVQQSDGKWVEFGQPPRLLEPFVRN